jgi:phosphopantothenoylcysteine synthetase/decarboxylase
MEDLLGWINGHAVPLTVVAPISKRLACDDIGVGAMAGRDEILASVARLLAEPES